MRQGLIAQWHRGIAVRGVVGALLLAVPVVVAATIGLGSVGVGLSSLATGPSENAVAVPTDSGGGHKGVELLTAALPLPSADNVGGDRGTGSQIAPTGAPGGGLSGSAPLSDQDASGNGGSGGGITNTGTPADQTTTAPAAPVNTGNVGSLNVDQMLGGGSGQTGFVGQLLHGLGLSNP